MLRILKNLLPMWVRRQLVPHCLAYVRGFMYYFYNHFIGKVPLFWMRHLYVRRVLNIPIGSMTTIHMGCFISHNNITVGRNTVVNRRCYLDGRGGIEIGSNVSISPEAYIISLSHYVNDSEYNCFGKKVVINDRVWIGARAIILPGVNIGQGAVVGAGAVVTKNVEPYTIVGGNPARVIGKRTEDLTYNLCFYSAFDTDIWVPPLFN